MWKMFQGAPRASATASEIQQAARKYRYSLRHAEDAVRHFSIRSGFEQRLGRLSAGKVGGRTSDEYTTISDWDCRELLSPAALGDPHGWALLDLEFPKLPDVPNPPEILAGTSESEPQQFEALARKVSVLKADAERAFAADVARASALRAACEANDPRAIETLAQLTLLRHPVPWVFSFEPLVEFDPSARVILATITVPDFVRANFCKGLDTNKPLSVLAKKKAQELCLHSLCLRAAFLLARGDAGNWWDTVAINAYQEWFDPATGSPRNGIIASLQATKSELLQIQTANIDVKACFRHFKGITTPAIDRVTPIRPIFVLNKIDRRIIENRDVDASLEARTNLAAMEWDDFEHLVRQLFEWEFGSNGVEVKVTRASRDRGVDAIMFDPDPLRGGKFVLQAKRYTRPVDVAAVRDLYGTVVNEGANRGILVTTSSYGPDAYDFAKNKPISLVDGPNLLALLRKHGRNYRINLAEARAIAAAQE